MKEVIDIEDEFVVGEGIQDDGKVVIEDLEDKFEVVDVEQDVLVVVEGLEDDVHDAADVQDELPDTG